MHLVIVESPTKARKLKSYLGSDFTVEASVGHVRDLPSKQLGVDVDNNFEPTYEVSEGKTKVISQLKKLAATADDIYLATDPDREGEAIAWHVQQLLLNATKLKKKDLDFKRASFHEITKPAVLKAIENSGTINMDLVDAQQARRVVDRLVGYKLSPVLWKKIRRGLSAGRVQSVALRLIVEREREIEAFVPDEYWELDVALQTQQGNAKGPLYVDGNLISELPESVLIGRVIEVGGKKFEPKTEKDVSGLVVALPEAEYTINSIEKKERKRQSVPPFTTSTLQQRAALTFGMSSKDTMRVAQQLYEEGLITYHRTDSFNLSQSSVGMARNFIKSVYGDKYLPEKPRYFANKAKNAQEAHEAIRVTDVSVQNEAILKISSKFTSKHVKVYDLIWRRFVASQMSEAIYDQTSILTAFKSSGTKKYEGMLRTSGSTMKFDGWLRLFPSGEDTLLPEVSEKEQLKYVDQLAAQKFTQPPPRYNDASIIKTLEKMGIGRPSTYASIISVIQDRGYVEKKEKRFFATAIGITVSDFLLEHFPTIMDYEFTAEMEEDLDRISLGKKEWRNIIKQFYKPFEAKLETVTEKAERVQIPVEKTGEKCPKCGDTDEGEIVLRTGRYGKFKSCSRFPDCDFTENFTQKVPDVVCPLCAKGEVVIKNTRWGKSFFGCGRYPDCDWASWKQPEKGETITKEAWAAQQKAREERKAKRQAKWNKGKKETASKAKTSAKVVKKKTTKKSTAKTNAKRGKGTKST